MSMSFKDFYNKHKNMLDFEVINLDVPTPEGFKAIDSVNAAEGYVMFFGDELVSMIANDPESTDGNAGVIYFHNEGDEEIHTEHSIDEEDFFDVFAEIRFYKEVTSV